jgi:hypothetical protein
LNGYVLYMTSFFLQNMVNTRRLMVLSLPSSLGAYRTMIVQKCPIG